MVQSLRETVGLLHFLGRGHIFGGTLFISAVACHRGVVKRRGTVAIHQERQVSGHVLGSPGSRVRWTMIIFMTSYGRQRVELYAGHVSGGALLNEQLILSLP